MMRLPVHRGRSQGGVVWSSLAGGAAGFPAWYALGFIESHTTRGEAIARTALRA